MYDLILFFGFILQMLIGVPLYAALLMTSLLGLIGIGNLTLLRVIPQHYSGVLARAARPTVSLKR